MKTCKKSSFLNGRWGWSDTSDDWLVKLMMIIIAIIIDHYPSSRVSLFKFSKFSSPQAARGHWLPPNQNPADALVYAETPGQQTQGRQICTQLAEINMPKLCKWDQNNVHSLEIRSPGMFQLDRRSVHVTENKLTATGECRLETGSRHIAFKRLLNIY